MFNDVTFIVLLAVVSTSDLTKNISTNKNVMYIYAKKTNCETSAQSHGQYNPEKWDCQESGENGLSRIWTFTLTTQPDSKERHCTACNFNAQAHTGHSFYVKHR